MRAIGLYQLRVTLQRINDLMGVLASLLQGVDNAFWRAIGQYVPGLLVGLLDCAQAKVFNFQYQNAAPGVHHDEVGVH